MKQKESIIDKCCNYFYNKAFENSENEDYVLIEKETFRKLIKEALTSLGIDSGLSDKNFELCFNEFRDDINDYNEMFEEIKIFLRKLVFNEII